MRHNFCAMILTHGRADSVITEPSLRRSGYTGPIYFLIDDEDRQGDLYRKKYGDRVISFSKKAIHNELDRGDNLPQMNIVLHARNACFDVVKKLGYDYFIMLDDDYGSWMYRYDKRVTPTYTPIRKTMDDLLDGMVDLLNDTGSLCVAFAQGGDYIGGGPDGIKKKLQWKRKVMNTFVFNTSKPMYFQGRVNEDVNAYVTYGSRGHLMFQVFQVCVTQGTTQANQGGLTETYLNHGTYVKSFYSVMCQPSFVKVSTMGSNHVRIHHSIQWNNAVPKVVAEKYRKPLATA